MATFSVVIPAYNEEDGIGEIMQRVLATREKLREVGFTELELIVAMMGRKIARRSWCAPSLAPSWCSMRATAAMAQP